MLRQTLMLNRTFSKKIYITLSGLTYTLRYIYKGHIKLKSKASKIKGFKKNNT